MYWVNFIHIYQPPIQKKTILERVVKESYRKITEGLITHPNAKLTLNINAGLTEMLIKNGFDEIIRNLQVLLERKQIEITATAKFHPFLPKLPENEVVRQIKLNEETHKKFFGSNYQPRGFFPPEMAYSPNLGRIIKELGYEWIILDETAIDQPVDYTKIYQNDFGLKFFFRERSLSFQILSAQIFTAKSLVKDLSKRTVGGQFLLTAMDGETFGHHRPGLEHLLWDICKEPEVKTITVSEIENYFTDKILANPKNSSWAFTRHELIKNSPFVRWDDKENPIHQKQWKLVNLAISAVEMDQRAETRELLDESLYSDQFWWASARPWWSLEMIEHGAHKLLKTIESCILMDNKIKRKAKRLYFEIITTGFEWQRTGKVDELARKEDEEIQERLNGEKNALSPAEKKEMVNTLKKQLQISIKNQEFLRAEEIKNRIKELTDSAFNPSFIPKVNQ